MKPVLHDALAASVAAVLFVIGVACWIIGATRGEP